MVKFIAHAVAAEEYEDLNCLVVVLAENSTGEGKHLKLQRALHFDKQDIDLGHGTYCLATESQETHYGGVKSWSWCDSELQINLSPKAGEALGVEDGFRIKVPTSELANLKNAVSRVLSG